VGQHIPEETIQEVLLRADIVDIVGEYVHLKKSGANYKGLCPFHGEKTPSFTVSPSKGLYHCFGCRASGNVMRFLMQHEHLTFPEAVRMLAIRYGVRIPEASSGGGQQDALQPLYALHEAAATFFHRCLLRDPAAQQARLYCRQRQISSDVATRFTLGYAPSTWEALAQEMQRQGFSEELLVQSGLVATRDRKPGVYDRFRHRLMFPIHDRQGRPVAFGGRLLEGSNASHAPKYLNSPETPIFRKSRILYGLHLARHSVRQEGRALIVEGYTDVIACHRHGITNAIGTLGTALTEQHVGVLRSLVSEVVLVFDGDTAGGAAAERSIGLFLEAGMRVRIVELPSGEDPDSFLQRRGRETFVRHVEEATTFLEFLLARSGRFSDVQTPTGRADCVSRLVPFIRKVTNQIERWGYVELLAKKIGVPVEVLHREIESRSAPSNRKRRAPAAAARPVQEPAPRPAAPFLPRAEYDLLRLVLHDGSWFERVRRQVTPDDFQNPLLRDMYALLLRLAPWDEQAVFSRLTEQVEHEAQRQVLAQMATEPLLGDAAGRDKMLHDYLRQLQQRRLQARLSQLKDAMRGAAQRGDAAEQQRLLRDYAGLRQEMRLQYQ
jgi:DNA primase